METGKPVQLRKRKYGGNSVHNCAGKRQFKKQLPGVMFGRGPLFFDFVESTAVPYYDSLKEKCPHRKVADLNYG